MKYHSISKVYNDLRLDNECLPENTPIGLQSKGYTTFAYSADQGLIHRIIDKPAQYEIYGDLFTGKEFYVIVDEGGIINKDGILGEVFIDGYASNLGLAHGGLCQGKFLVDGTMWLKLCQEHEILVEWCNK